MDMGLNTARCMNPECEAYNLPGITDGFPWGTEIWCGACGKFVVWDPETPDPDPDSEVTE